MRRRVRGGGGDTGGERKEGEKEEEIQLGGTIGHFTTVCTHKRVL